MEEIPGFFFLTENLETFYPNPLLLLPCLTKLIKGSQGPPSSRTVIGSRGRKAQQGVRREAWTQWLPLGIALRLVIIHGLAVLLSPISSHFNLSFSSSQFLPSFVTPFFSSQKCFHDTNVIPSSIFIFINIASAGTVYGQIAFVSSRVLSVDYFFFKEKKNLNHICLNQCDSFLNFYLHQCYFNWAVFHSLLNKSSASTSKKIFIICLHL